MPSSDEDIMLEDDEEEQLILKTNNVERKTTKKLGISAEAYGEYNQLNDFVPTIVSKSDEQN